MLLELRDVIGSKHLYVPDERRKATMETSAMFEKAVARVTRIFYAEYEDYVRMKLERDDEGNKVVEVSCDDNATKVL